MVADPASRECSLFVCRSLRIYCQTGLLANPPCIYFRIPAREHPLSVREALPYNVDHGAFRSTPLVEPDTSRMGVVLFGCRPDPSFSRVKWSAHDVYVSGDNDFPPTCYELLHARLEYSQKVHLVRSSRLVCLIRAVEVEQDEHAACQLARTLHSLPEIAHDRATFHIYCAHIERRSIHFLHEV